MRIGELFAGLMTQYRIVVEVSECRMIAFRRSGDGV